MCAANKDIVLEMLEVTINARQYEREEEYYSPECIFHGAPYVGAGFYPDDSLEGKMVVKVVTPGGPSEGKLRVGDRIVAAADDHITLTTFEQLRDYRMGPGEPGTPITYNVIRDGEPEQVTVFRGMVPGYTLRYEDTREINRAYLKTTWPDLRVNVELALQDGDLVAVYCIYSGMNMDFKRYAVWPACELYRVLDGKIVDYWSVSGDYMMMMQLGYTLNLPVE